MMVWGVRLLQAVGFIKFTRGCTTFLQLQDVDYNSHPGLFLHFQLLPIAEKELTRPICKPAIETLETAIRIQCEWGSLVTGQ